MEYIFSSVRYITITVNIDISCLQSVKTYGSYDDASLIDVHVCIW